MARPEVKPWMVRAMDGNDETEPTARAVLSSAYKPLDNLMAVQALAAAVTDRIGLEVKSQSLTGTRLYVQAIDRSTQRTIEVRTPNYRGERERTLFAGFTFSNSEVGMGAFALRESIFNQWCSNLATSEYVLRQTHVGTRFSSDEEVRKWVSDEALKADQVAMKLALRDAVVKAMDPATLDRWAHRMQLAAEPDRAMTRPVPEVIELSKKRYSWNDKETEDIMDCFIRAGDLSQFGLHSAVTEHAQKAEPDRAHELEVGSVQILDMGAKQWAALAQKG
jgi:hypothetical protein